MNGRDLTLGALAGLAVAGMVAKRRRGSRDTKQVPLLRYADGRLIRVFHGSPRTDFEWFSTTPDRRYTLNETNSLGIWFTTDPRVASTFALHRDEDGGGGVFPAYLRLKSPKIYVPETRIYSGWVNGDWRKIQVLNDPMEQMMDDRDPFTEYPGRKPIRCNSDLYPPAERGYWRSGRAGEDSKAANVAFVAHLQDQGYDGIWMKRSRFDGILYKRAEAASFKRFTYDPLTRSFIEHHDRSEHDVFCVFDASSIVSAIGRGRP